MESEYYGVYTQCGDYRDLKYELLGILKKENIDKDKIDEFCKLSGLAYEIRKMNIFNVDDRLYHIKRFLKKLEFKESIPY